MGDLEMNAQDSWNAHLLSHASCSCDHTRYGDLCESCMKYNQEESDISSMSSLSVARDPVVWANLLMLFSVFLYSANSVIIRKFVVLGGTGAGFLFLRSVISIPFLMFLTFGLRLNKDNPMLKFHEDRKVNLVMVAGCLSGAMRQSLLPFIMKESEASTIGILSPSIPLVTAVISHMFKIERLTKTTVFCLVLSTMGLVFGLDLLNKFNDSTKLTYDLLLLIPFTKSFQVVFLKMASNYFDGLTLLRNQIAISVLFCLPVSLLVTIFQAESLKSAVMSLVAFNFEQILCALYSVVAILFVGWRIQIHSLKVLGANAVALFQTLRPFFTMILGAIFLEEQFTFKKTVGSLVVCVALVVYQKNRVRPTEQH